jgi:hypothetical protein
MANDTDLIDLDSGSINYTADFKKNDESRSTETEASL